MPTRFAALMCHAPIVVPAVGGNQSRRCRNTTRAMRQVAARAVASQPDRLVLVSPHSPRRRRGWGAWAGPLHGDLGRFDAPEVSVDLPAAPEVRLALDLAPIDAAEFDLDHGAMVPLAFLWAAGWRGPTAVLSQPWEDAEGERIGRALAALPGQTAVIASGDMSHRLSPGAPSGFHPDAARFDEAFVHALRHDDWGAAVEAPCREIAAEDVVESSRVAMAAAGRPLNTEVLSYEGPWGVGYTEAIFYDPAPPLWAVARRAVAAAALGQPFQPPEGGPAAAGAFVTLTRREELRGCIGHLAPTRDRMYEELADVARAAALDDPRFPPLGPEELDATVVEVSVLEPPEPAASPADLDPAVFGCIVSAGERRGVLLPDIDEVTTPAQQIAICRRKAGIGPHEPVTLERFRVRKEREP